MGGHRFHFPIIPSRHRARDRFGTLCSMRRREYLKTLGLAPLALSPASAATTSGGRFRPAICAYSFRNQLKDKSMTYADLIRMAADLGADGIDLTTYWLADTNDDTLYALKRQAYHSAVELYT